MRTCRLLLNGLGHVGRRFLELVRDREDELAQRHGLRLRLVGAVDSRGGAWAQDGLDLGVLVALKASGGSVAEVGQPGVRAQDLLETCAPNLVLEAAPTDLGHGQPGLDLARAALRRGIHVVMAAKAPLVLAYEELAALSSRSGGPRLRFSGAVGGALPTVNVALRDLIAARVSRVEGVLNLTSQIILARMTAGLDFQTALAEAQALGLAEADPSLDVDGLDAACKLLILAKVLWGAPGGLETVSIQGIRDLQAVSPGLALLATGEFRNGQVALKVAPTSLGPGHPFRHLEPDEGALRYHTDIYGCIQVSCARQGPLGTAAALLRDVVDLLGERA